MQTNLTNPYSTELYLCKHLGAPHLPAYLADTETADFSILLVKDHGSPRRKDMYILAPKPHSSAAGAKKEGSGNTIKQSTKSKSSAKSDSKYYEPDWLFWNST